MNCTNAVAFLVCGIAMWASPSALPGLFRHTAIDGASTRALWIQFMGLVHCVFGSAFLIRRWATVALEGMRTLAEQRGAVATGDWQPDATPPRLVFVDFSPHHVAGTARAIAASSFSAAEARLTNLVGRSGEARQAA
jgi:hypothetical protein